MPRTSTRLIRPALLVLALSCACEEPQPPAAQCTPGATSECACAQQGSKGTQLCRPDGTLAECDCEPKAPEPVPTPEPTPTVAPIEPPAPPPAAPAVEDAAAAEAPAIPPDTGTYDVEVTHAGECLSLSGPPRALPTTTKTQHWKIHVVGPTSITVNDGSGSHTATLANDYYVYNRKTELGRMTVTLRFTAAGISGKAHASAVTHHGKNRRTAEDCTETLTIAGHKS
jgi:hypothetical protein